MDQSTRRQLLKILGMAATAPALSAVAAHGQERDPTNEDAPDVTDEQRKLVAYCGLYCGLCSGHCRLPEHAQALLGTLGALERVLADHWENDSRDEEFLHEATRALDGRLREHCRKAHISLAHT